MLILRSALYNLTFFTSLVIYVPVVALTFPLPSLVRFGFVKQWARFHLWSMRHLCGLNYRLEGQENLPAGAVILFSKHQSTWETVAFHAIFPPFAFVLKRELMWIPLFGWAVKQLDPIAIDRKASGKAVAQIVQQGRERLQNGRWVTVFPEGTRMAPGTRRRYGIGGAVLASATGFPVVPIAHNAGSYWPRRGFVKRPGTIRVIIGPVVESRGRTPEEINRQAEDWIENTMRELEGPLAMPQAKAADT